MTINSDKLEEILLMRGSLNIYFDDVTDLIFSILEDLPYGICINKIVLNEFFEAVDFRFLYVNREFQSIFSVQREQIVGRYFSEMHKDTSKFSRELKLLGKISSQGGNFKFERYIEEYDKWLQFNAFSSMKEIFVISCVDVTESKKLQFNFAEVIQNLEDSLSSRTTSLQETIDNLRMEIAERQSAEEQLLQAREELQILLENEKKLIEIKDRFINVLVKEFRDPLTVIKTSVDLLKMIPDRTENEDTEQIFERMHISINQLVESMDNVHLLAEKNVKLTLDNGHHEIIPLFYQIMDEVKEWDEKKHCIIFNHPTHRVLLKTDKIVLQAILRIILKNACQYSESDKEIIIEMEDLENSLVFFVQDSGIGIPNHELPMIFEPLFRATNAKTSYGSGVGLSIVKKYSQMLKAEIHVSSVAGQGTKFIVSLPKF